MILMYATKKDVDTNKKEEQKGVIKISEEGPKKLRLAII